MSRKPSPPSSTASRSSRASKAPGARPRKPESRKPESRFEAHEPQRIAKLLARAGVGSRRDIERMIAEGRVALNGEVLATPATILTSLEGVVVDGRPVADVEPTRLWRFFKPAGCLTTVRDPAGRPTIYDLLPKGMPRVVTIGRLDYNTEGLLLLTNNGELKRWLELPANSVERIYRARVRGRIDYNALADLIEGITIDGVRYGSINTEVESSHGLTHWIAVKIREGKNREVRNVLGHLGLQVSRLIRTDYGPFTLDGLRDGEVQEISPGAIPGVPGDLLPPPGFEVEDMTPRRREEFFTLPHHRRAVEATAPASRETPARAQGRDTRDDARRRAPRAAAPEAEALAEPVRLIRRRTRTAEARQAETRGEEARTGKPPSPQSGRDRPQAGRDRPQAGKAAKPAARPARKGAQGPASRQAAGEAAETGRKKLERKPGWAKPKISARPKPRGKPRGRRP